MTTNKRLINTHIQIDEGEDKEKIKHLFNKILHGSIPLSELKALTVLFQSLCQYADNENKIKGK